MIEGVDDLSTDVDVDESTRETSRYISTLHLALLVLRTSFLSQPSYPTTDHESSRIIERRRGTYLVMKLESLVDLYSPLPSAWLLISRER